MPGWYRFRSCTSLPYTARQGRIYRRNQCPASHRMADEPFILWQDIIHSAMFTSRVLRDQPSNRNKIIC